MKVLIGIWTFVTFLYENREKCAWLRTSFRDWSITKGLERSDEVCSYMQNIIDEIKPVHRVLLLKFSNCGGAIDQTIGDYHVSIVLEEYDHKTTHPVRKQYQEFPVDMTYVRMIGNLLRHKTLKFRVKDLPQGTLKGEYIKLKKEYLELKHIKTSKNKKSIFFISVSTSSKRDDFERPEFRHSLEQNTRSIRKVFKH